MTARDSPGLLLGPCCALIGQQLAWPGCDWPRAGRALDKFGEGLERAESRHQTWGNYEAELRAVMNIIWDIMVKQEIVRPQSQSEVSNHIPKTTWGMGLELRVLLVILIINSLHDFHHRWSLLFLAVYSLHKMSFLASHPLFCQNHVQLSSCT